MRVDCGPVRKYASALVNHMMDNLNLYAHHDKNLNVELYIYSKDIKLFLLGFAYQKK